MRFTMVAVHVSDYRAERRALVAVGSRTSVKCFAMAL